MNLFAIIPKQTYHRIGRAEIYETLRTVHSCHAMSLFDPLDRRTLEQCLALVQTAVQTRADVSANGFVTQELRYCLGRMTDILLHNLQLTTSELPWRQLQALTHLVNRLQTRHNFRINAIITCYWGQIQKMDGSRRKEEVLIVKAAAILEQQSSISQQLQFRNLIQHTKQQIQEAQNTGIGFNFY